MRNTVPIIALVVIVAVVGISAAALTLNNQSVAPEETVELLNSSGDLIQVTNIADFTLILKQPDIYIKNFNYKHKDTSSLLSRSQIQDAYNSIYEDFGMGEGEVKISVSDLYTCNGIKFYVVSVVIDTDDYTDTYIFYQDAYIKPTLGDEGITGVITSAYMHSPKDSDNQEAPKYSQEQILELAKAEYAKHVLNSTGDEKYDIQLSYIGEDPIYSVDINNEDQLEYDGNSGELLFSSLGDEVDYESIAREVAQKRLNEEDNEYSDNLTLGNVNNTTDDNQLLYTFEIVFTDDNGKQTVGYITVDAKTKEVVDFELNDPKIIEDAEEPEVDSNTADNEVYYQDHSYNSQPHYSVQESDYDDKDYQDEEYEY